MPTATAIHEEARSTMIPTHASYQPRRITRHVGHAPDGWADRMLRPCADDQAAWDRHLARQIGPWWSRCTPNADTARWETMAKLWHLTTFAHSTLIATPSRSPGKGGSEDELRALRCVAYGDTPVPTFTLGRALDDIWAEVRASTSHRLRLRMIDAFCRSMQPRAGESHVEDGRPAAGLDGYEGLIWTTLEYGLGIDLSYVLRADPHAFDDVHTYARHSLDAATSHRIDTAAEYRQSFLDAGRALSGSAFGERDDVRAYVAEIEHMLIGFGQGHALTTVDGGPDSARTGRRR